MHKHAKHLSAVSHVASRMLKWEAVLPQSWRFVQVKFVGQSAIGLLGVLIEAKRAALIPAARPILDGLIEKAGFWIGHELYERVLKAAGE